MLKSRWTWGLSACVRVECLRHWWCSKPTKPSERNHASLWVPVYCSSLMHNLIHSFSLGLRFRLIIFLYFRISHTHTDTPKLSTKESQMITKQTDCSLPRCPAQKVYGRVWGAALLTSCQMVRVLLVWGGHTSRTIELPVHPTPTWHIYTNMYKIDN